MRRIVKKYLNVKTQKEKETLICAPENIRVNFELVIKQVYEHLKTCPLKELPLYVHFPSSAGQKIIKERLQKG